MKQIFFLAGIVAFSFAYGQQQFIIPKDQLGKKFNYLNLQKPKTDSFPFLSHFLNQYPQATLMQVLPNRNKLYSLPLDHMPCIVPDMSQFNKNDLASSNFNFNFLIQERNLPGKIPNAITPYRIIPENK
jgi:hypothetical protein